MNSTPFRPPILARLRALGTHLAHDVVWLLIAVLFCVVEGAVLISEIRPTKLVGRRRLNARPTRPSVAPANVDLVSVR